MAWAKLHTDVLGDVKLMRASRKGARHLVLLPWLIAFAKLADDDGRLSIGGVPAEPEDIASLIPDAKPAHVLACCASLATIGVLTTEDDGAYRFTQWSKRSDAYPSDDPAAVRELVRQHRKKQRETSNGNESHSLHETSGNESVKRGALAREVEESREEKRKRGPRNDPDWFPEARSVWESSVGPIQPRKLMTALTPLLAKNAWSVVKGALEVYVSADEGPAAQGRDRRVDWFAADFHRWRAIAETPIDDGQGGLTDRGRKLARSA